MPFDTSRTLEIEGSPAKMLGLVTLGILMTALSAATAFRLIGTVRPGSFIELVGYVGVLLFGSCTAVTLWRLFAARRPIVTLTPEGIRDTRVAAEFVPWRAVRGITTWSLQGQKVVVLAVDPAVESRLTLTAIAKWSRGANRALGADGLCISAQGLKIDFDTLLDASVAYARSAQEAR